MEDERETSNLRQHRRRRSAMNLSCCFHGSSDNQYDFITQSPPFSDSGKSSPAHKSPSSWFRSSKGNAGDHHLPEIKSRRRNFMSRLGRPPRRHSADFSYDPLSYALNFDDGNYSDDFVHDRHLVSRLPVSPLRVRATRLRDLELPSRPSGRKNGESPMKPKSTEGAAESESGKVKSPTAVHVRKSSGSPTVVAAHGIRKVQSPMKVPGQRSGDSPKAATGGRLGVEQRRAAPRQIFVEH